MYTEVEVVVFPLYQHVQKHSTQWNMLPIKMSLLSVCDVCIKMPSYQNKITLF